MIDIDIFRSKAKGLPDILNYAACVDEGVVLGKDGSLMAGFTYVAGDIHSLTLNDRNAIAAKMNAALLRFGNGWCLHIDAFREKVSNYVDTDKNHFQDPISQLIDDERREQFVGGQYYETTLTIILTYLLPSNSKSKISDLMFQDEVGSIKETPLEKAMNYFSDTLSEFESTCSNFISIKRMLPKTVQDEFGNTHIQDELLSYINYSIIGERHPVNVPKIGMYMDSYMGCYQFYSGLTPRIEKKYIGVVAIDGFPQESYANILARFTDLNLTYRWNTRWIFMDEQEAEAKLKKQRAVYNQQTRPFMDQFLGKNGRINEHAVAMVGEVDNAIADIHGGYLSFGYLSTNIILLDEDRDNLDFNLAEVKRIITNHGFNPRIEDVNAVEAWIGSLPGHVGQNVRRPIASTFNLAHFMPLNSIWAGEEFNPSNLYLPSSPPLAHVLTTGATPFRLNLHVDDLGHTLIFGPTGAGKSTLLAFLAASHRRYSGAKIVAFDKGRSLYPLTAACRGLHFDVANENSHLSFAPLANLKTEADRAWASEWVETLLTLQGVDVLPTHRKKLHEALTLHINNDSKSLTEFVSNIQDTDLRAALDHYTLAGSMGFMLDSETDGLQLSDFTTFELEDLMNFGDKNLVPVLLYLFHRIEMSLDGSPTMLILDEAWIALGHPVFKEKIREWLKVLRKANCFVVMATQSLSDAAKSGILDVLQESCPTKILLPNQDAYNRGSEHALGPYDLYQQFGLNHVQIGMIAEATKKRDYYVISPLGTRMFQLALGKITLAFTAASDKESISVIKKLEEKHEDQWPFKWLEYKGVKFEHLLSEAQN